MPNPKLKWGGKITCSHSTITETAAKVIQAAHTLDEVTKISAGIIKHVGGGEQRLKFLTIVGGIKAVVRGNGAVQEIFIWTKNPAETERTLLASFKC